MKKMLVIDFNDFPCYFDASTQGASNEHRKNSLFSSYGIPTSARIPQMRQALRGRIQNKKLLLHRSVSMHGLRAVDVSRESARHRVMPALHADAAVSHGHPWKNFKEHSCRRKRIERLADLRGLRASFDSHGQATLSPRAFRDRTERDCLRPGCHHDRSLPYSFPLGTVPEEQS